MATSSDPYKLSRPTVYLGLMLVFLILSAFVVLILSPQISGAFMANPGLNGLIIGVLAIGTLLSFWQVMRLRPEIRWVNQHRIGEKGLALQEAPRLLAPMASLLRDRDTNTALTTQTMRSMLDSIGMRLDEAREITRYIIGLLVFLGLLGTFWGLTQTVSAVSQTIDSLDVSGGEIGAIFENLKTGLAAPLGGMGTAFSSSLFGLAGSLVLGFLDLQAGQAQNRFYTELEDWMSTITEIDVSDKSHDNVTTAVTAIDKAAERLAHSVESGGNKEGATALSNLAEGIQSLVQHMRSEQQMIREWVEAQADQQEKLANVLDRLTSAIDTEDTETK